ncbi:MAG: V-type ATP synthase subunit D [Sphaerochaetaceae bacterium]|nr:V-type ATP synthase subunit D [Sphaerochaetaceae bacterium]
MMAVKLTKNEQKKQKDQLKQFQRYLPTLQLKKQQLQVVIRQIETKIELIKKQQQELAATLDNWIAVYNENKSFPKGKRLEDLIQVDFVKKSIGNIAGVSIPVFDDIKFKKIEYDLEKYPLWVDAAVVVLRDLARFDAIISTLTRQVNLLSRELRTTSQRVNLFEKVKIPEARENIKRIGIYLGDQQTTAVVRGKIAKNKLIQKAQL